MYPLNHPSRLAAGFGDSMAMIRFQQEMRRAFGGIVRYSGAAHGGMGIGAWVNDSLAERTLSLSCTTTASSTTVTTASTASLSAIVGVGITGTGIPWGAQIQSITNGTTFALSTPATASGTVTLEFSNLAQDEGVWDGLIADEICLFFSIGTNDAADAGAVATFEAKLDAIIAHHLAATGATVARCVATLPYHAPGHATYIAGNYNPGQPGYNLRALLTAKAAANPTTFAVVNYDDLNRAGDNVHLDTQADNAIFADRMRDAMLALIYP